MPMSPASDEHIIPNCRYINYPELNHYTIVFGVSDAVARDIRNFIEAKEE